MLASTILSTSYANMPRIGHLPLFVGNTDTKRRLTNCIAVILVTYSARNCYLNFICLKPEKHNRSIRQPLLNLLVIFDLPYRRSR